MLRPVPEYSMNPFYWLGALTAIAFVLQVVTGLLMLIYYVPTTDQAYASTLFIIKYVPMGWLIETVHLYGAYAMILLAFLHLFRGYFASVHKKPRELMWVVGMMMGLVVLGFGLTGYLLSWTVVSKSATDVSIGMISFLPAQIGPIMTFLIAGTGNAAAELTRFFDLHIVVLPAALLLLLVLKMYMFEAHGAAEPVSGPTESREVSWFPTVYLYFGILGCAFVAVIIAAAALFPLSLAPEFSPQAASVNVPQPEWYFLWIYQVLKFASFEGSGIYYALGAVTVLVAVITLLPFIDRGQQRHPAARPIYTTLGFMLAAELVTLTVWGFFTPGQVISDSQGITITGEAALTVAAMSALVYLVRARMKGAQVRSTPLRIMALPFTHRAITGLFVLPLVVGSVCLANLVSALTGGAPDAVGLTANAVILAASMYAMFRIVASIGPARRRPVN